MRLHIIGPEITSLDEVWNFSGVYGYYLRRIFLDKGVDLEFSPAWQHADVEYLYRSLKVRADHILAFGTRYFDKIPPNIPNILREKITGAITQLCDHRVYSPRLISTTFSMKDYTGLPGYTYVGWAADPELCVPQQGKRLTILVDHPNYSKAGPDITNDILNQLLEFRRQTTKPIDIKIMDRDGIVPYYQGQDLWYGRSKVKHKDLCRDFGKVHVFVVTHQESLGQSALEAAMAGALIVVPDGFMALDRLATIRCYTFKQSIDWWTVLSMVDPERSAKVARRNSWDQVVTRILKYFEGRVT